MKVDTSRLDARAVVRAEDIVEPRTLDLVQARLSLIIDDLRRDGVAANLQGRSTQLRVLPQSVEDTRSGSVRVTLSTTMSGAPGIIEARDSTVVLTLDAHDVALLGDPVFDLRALRAFSSTHRQQLAAALVSSGANVRMQARQAIDDLLR